MNKMNNRESQFTVRFCLSADSSFYQSCVRAKFDASIKYNLRKTMKKTMIMLMLMLGTSYANAQTGTFKDPVSFKLKNGLTVIVAENESANKVLSTLTIDADPASTDTKAGVKELLTLLLNENAGKTATGLSFNENGGNLAVLPDDFDAALSALSTTVKLPAIDQSSVDMGKSKLIANLQTKDRYYANEVTVVAVQALSLADVRKFYSEHVSLSRAYLTIAGQITLDEAKDLVKKSFGNWEPNSFSDAI